MQETRRDCNGILYVVCRLYLYYFLAIIEFQTGNDKFYFILDYTEEWPTMRPVRHLNK